VAATCGLARRIAKSMAISYLSVLIKASTGLCYS